MHTQLSLFRLIDTNDSTYWLWCTTYWKFEFVLDGNYVALYKVASLYKTDKVLLLA